MNTFERSSVVRRALSMGVLALTVLSGPAMAQKADRPGVRVGDQWQFVLYYGIPFTKPNRTWVIHAVTPTRIEGTENGEPLMLTLDLNVLESPQIKNSNPELLRFPLEVGKRWSYSSDWLFKVKRSKGRSHVEVAVVGHEKVSVVAGEFDAFKLEAKDSFRGISGIDSQLVGESVATYWYAPAARTIVKSVMRNPYLGTSTVELVEFQLRP